MSCVEVTVDDGPEDTSGQEKEGSLLKSKEERLPKKWKVTGGRDLEQAERGSNYC